MTDDGLIARRFSKMMVEGRIRAALKMLSDNSDTGLLSLDDIADDVSGKTVRDVLEDKHPDPRPAHPDVLLITNMKITLVSKIHDKDMNRFLIKS